MEEAYYEREGEKNAGRAVVGDRFRLGGSSYGAGRYPEDRGVERPVGCGSEWGLAQDRGTKIAAMEKANAKGGLKVGNKTYKIEVISYDDPYKAALAVSGCDAPDRAGPTRSSSSWGR